MYKADFRIIIKRENMNKIHRVLKEKWNAKNITLRELMGSWKISFLIPDHRKVFAFMKVVANYEGTVLRWGITKIKEGSRSK